MPARARLPVNALDVLAPLLHKSKTKAEFQRVQSVWLRASLDLTDDQIAIAVGLSCNTVRCLHSRFRLQGEEALVGVGRGGRRRQNLSIEQEDELLHPFLDEAGAGGILVANPIKIAYEQAVGHEVPKSTVYRLLARHGWRKLVPRPRHPKAKDGAQEEFKKNSRRSSQKK